MDHPEPLLAHLGPVKDYLGAHLGKTWHLLGSLWLSHINLGLSWASLARLGPVIDHLGAHLGWMYRVLVASWLSQVTLGGPLSIISISIELFEGDYLGWGGKNNSDAV